MVVALMNLKRMPCLPLMSNRADRTHQRILLIHDNIPNKSPDSIVPVENCIGNFRSVQSSGVARVHDFTLLNGI